VTITAADLTFRDPGGIDVSAEYTVTPDPANPSTVAAGATEVLAFSVDVAAMPTIDLITVDGMVTGTDQVTMAQVADSSAAITHDWDVVGALVELRVVDAPDATVSQGSTGHLVTVTAENVGINPVDVTALALTFTGSADRTSEYTVTPDPANPPMIAGATLETFTFAVDVDPAATTELVTLDAGITVQDPISLSTDQDTGADVTDQWDVLVCLASSCGDCNGDGMVTILDALVAAQHSAALITLTGVDFSNCNVVGALEPDPSAEVSILDALTLAQAAAGLPAALVCC
jgi:hypothetical protein